MQTLTSTIMIYKPNQTWSYWQPFPQSRKQGLADDQQGWMATNIKPDQINNLFADKEKTYHDRCINNSQASDPFYTEIRVDNTILCIARGHRTRPGRMRRGNCVFTKVCMYPTLRRKLLLEEADDVRQHNLSMRALKRSVGTLVHFRGRWKCQIQRQEGLDRSVGDQKDSR